MYIKKQKHYLKTDYFNCYFVEILAKHQALTSYYYLLDYMYMYPSMSATFIWLIQQIFTYLFLGHNSTSYLSNTLTQSQEQSSMQNTGL